MKPDRTTFPEDRVSDLPVHGNGLPTYQELLDVAVELTFPASDPIAVSADARAAEPVPSYQQLLDEAVEMTFPASDPVAAYACLDSKEDKDWKLDRDEAGKGSDG